MQDAVPDTHSRPLPIRPARQSSSGWAETASSPRECRPQGRT